MDKEIVMVGGEKGGVGKSMVCKTLVEYHIERDLPFTVFDTDRSNPDVWRLFQDRGCELAIFSEARRFQDAANPIFNAALDGRVLVNLPAQVFPSMKEWFDKNEILHIAREEGIQFILVFVTDGEYDSLSLLRKLLKHFQARVRHLVVKNNGAVKSEDERAGWSAFYEDDVLQDLITQVKANVIEFPAFHGDAELMTIDSQSLTFRKALSYKGFGLISRQRVRNFLRQANAAFDAAALFDRVVVPAQN